MASLPNLYTEALAAAALEKLAACETQGECVGMLCGFISSVRVQTLQEVIEFGGAMCIPVEKVVGLLDWENARYQTQKENGAAVQFLLPGGSNGK